MMHPLIAAKLMCLSFGWGSGLGVQGLGFRAWGSGFSLRVRVQASSTRLSEEDLAQKSRHEYV